jgi:TPR repeat protein
MKWFRMAAEQGHAGAQCILGISYSIGQGVPQDYLLAYFWTSLASKSTPCGSDTRGANYFYMDYTANAARQLTPEQLMKAQQMTREWEEKHPRK